MKRIAFSPLCILDDTNYVWQENSGVWHLNEVNTNRLYCDVANAGAEWQRIMPWGVWGKRLDLSDQFSPYVLAGDNPKFDLSRFNSWYFQIVRKVIEIAKTYGIKTWFCLADNCQFHGAYRKWSPWVTNIQGISSLYEEKARSYFNLWIMECLEQFSGLDIGWSWGNEMQPKTFIPLVEEIVFPYYKGGKLAFSESTYGSVMERAKYVNGEYQDTNCTQDQLKKKVGVVFGDAAKLAMWKEVHSVGEVDPSVVPSQLDQALTWWARVHNNHIRIWLSDDGVWAGDSLCDKEEDTGRTRPSAERWVKIINKTKPYANDFCFEHLPKGGDIFCQAKTLKEMYKAVYGKYPDEKYHYIPPQPPTPEPPTPPIPPIPPTPPEKPCSYFIKHLNIIGWLRCVLFGRH